ncbi:uncharacterized protein LOC132194808 [Neocloeon triangulifer]|uniref:uncharacterized protein LOC132194808 n=1 Tax=Neocloeon triangulifer TaxID=2078957 RepID=UPI00286F717A|nr:uncharacterized protein LOC132194808 [Neocloeon triangulifer]
MNAKVIIFLALAGVAFGVTTEDAKQKRDLYNYGYHPAALDHYNGYPYNTYNTYNPYASYNPYGLAYNPYNGLPNRFASPWNSGAVAPLGAPWGAAALAAPAIIPSTRPALLG